MVEDSKNLVILFADITGSVTIYEKLGNEKAKKIVSDCLAVLVDKAENSGGELIETIGDEVMTKFSTADQAFIAAVAMQEAHEGTPVSVRIGFNYGPVIQEDDKYFGDAINVAARMAARATAGEIMTTGLTVEQLSAEHRSSVRHLDTTTVKGRQEPIDIYEVIWQSDDGEDLTIMRTIKRPGEGPEKAHLEIAYNDEVHALDNQCGTFEIGRDSQCSLQIGKDEDWTSRKHAKIGFARGKFILTDISSNGTYVLLPGDQLTVLKREEMELVGAGKIGLGKKPGPDDSWVVRFRRID